jgi:hypothetical protein
MFLNTCKEIVSTGSFVFKLTYSVIYIPSLVELARLAVYTVATASLSRFVQVRPECMSEGSLTSSCRTLKCNESSQMFVAAVKRTYALQHLVQWFQDGDHTFCIFVIVI